MCYIYILNYNVNYMNYYDYLIYFITSNSKNSLISTKRNTYKLFIYLFLNIICYPT